MQTKQRKIIYAVAAAVLLACEIIIGVFFHDGFIRPLVGDVLVTALICCIIRVVLTEKPHFLALYVFIFAAAVEVSQYFDLAGLLHVKGTIIGVIIGTSFDWRDIVCYFVGCVIFFIVETICLHHKKSSEKNK